MLNKIGKQPPLKLKSAKMKHGPARDCAAPGLARAGGRLVFCIYFIFADFSLSGGCFGTDIIQNCTKWSNMGLHGLSYGPFVAKLRCASSLNSKKSRTMTIWSNKTQTCCFSWKNLWEATCLTPKLEKTICPI